MKINRVRIAGIVVRIKSFLFETPVRARYLSKLCYIIRIASIIKKVSIIRIIFVFYFILLLFSGQHIISAQYPQMHAQSHPSQPYPSAPPIAQQQQSHYYPYQQFSPYQQPYHYPYQLPPAPSMSPLIINNRIESNAGQSVDVSAQATPHVFQEVAQVTDQAQEAKLAQTQLAIQEQQQVLVFDLAALNRATEGFLSAHKWKIIFGMLLAGYLVVYRKLVEENEFIQNEHTWANWRPRFEDQSLEANLLQDIQLRYIDPLDPQNTLTPLINFYQHIESEEKRFTLYLAWATWIKKIRLTYFFPLKEYTIEYAQICKKRVLALQTVFLKWAAQRNFLSTSKEFENVPSAESDKSFCNSATT